MIVSILLICTLFFAFLSCRLAWRYKGIPLLLPIAMAACTYLYGTWVFISVYMKYAFGVCFALVLLLSLMRNEKKAAIKGGWFKRSMMVFWTLIFSTLSVLYFTGTTGKPYGIAHLAMPLKHGNYFVLQGGKGLPTNLFHFKLRTAIFAMDIVKLNKFGNRANTIFSKNLEDYETYGDTLYSPCSGRVMSSEDSNPDNPPGTPKRGPKNTNHILIRNNDIYVFLAHLKPGCVFVHKGDSVTVGQPIGCCGNTGMTIEPHLHIQVHERTDTTKPWYREHQLLINFNEQYYGLFEVIKAGK